MTTRLLGWWDYIINTYPSKPGPNVRTLSASMFWRMSGEPDYRCLSLSGLGPLVDTNLPVSDIQTSWSEMRSWNVGPVLVILHVTSSNLLLRYSTLHEKHVIPRHYYTAGVLSSDICFSLYMFAFALKNTRCWRDRGIREGYNASTAQQLMHLNYFFIACCTRGCVCLPADHHQLQRPPLTEDVSSAWNKRRQRDRARPERHLMTDDRMIGITWKRRSPLIFKVPGQQLRHEIQAKW